MPATRRARPRGGAATGGPTAKGAQKTLPFNNNTRITKSTSSSASAHQSKSLLQKADSPAPAKPLSAAVTLDDKDTTANDEDTAKTLGHVSSSAAVAQQAKTELAQLKQERTEEEVRASRVSDAQVRRYWKEREAERVAQRVHQEGLSVEEKVLRLFDISSQYGVCICSLFSPPCLAILLLLPRLFSLSLALFCWSGRVWSCICSIFCQRTPRMIVLILSIYMYNLLTRCFLSKQPCIGIARMKRWTRAQRLNLSPPIEVLAVLLKEEEKGNGGIERAYVDELMSSKLVEV